MLFASGASFFTMKQELINHEPSINPIRSTGIGLGRKCLIAFFSIIALASLPCWAAPEIDDDEDEDNPRPLHQKEWDKHEGKVIGKISLEHHKIFDPVSERKHFGRFQRSVNKHFPSSQRSLFLCGLPFQEGDQLDPKVILYYENELIDRRYLKSAKVLVTDIKGEPGKVAVTIEVQDAFPLEVYLSDPSFVYKNMFGRGHELYGGLLYNRLTDVFYNRCKGYHIGYYIPDIHFSRIKAKVRDFKTGKTHIQQIDVYRPFSDVYIRYGGGLKLRKDRKYKQLREEDDIERKRVAFDYRMLWLGRTFSFKPHGDNDYNKIILASSFSSKSFVERPKTTEKQNQHFDNYWQGLLSFGWVQRRHLRLPYIYSCTQEQKVPCGEKLNFTAGYRIGKLLKRPYFRFDISKSVYRNNLGYLYGGVSAGGFFNKSQMEQGVVRVDMEYFTGEWEIFNQIMRQYISLHYLGGLHRFEGETIGIGGRNYMENGFRTFGSDSWMDSRPGALKGYGRFEPRGTQRIKASYEAVVFTPINIGGFRVAFSGFVDGMFLKSRPNRDFDSYLGCGGGITVNGPYIFNFHINTCFYPVRPKGAPAIPFNFNILNVPVLELPPLAIYEPRVLTFE